MKLPLRYYICILAFIYGTIVCVADLFRAGGVLNLPARGPFLESRSETSDVPRQLAILLNGSNLLEEPLALWDRLLTAGRYREVIDSVMPTWNETAFHHDDRLRAYAGVYLAQAYLPLGETDSTLYYLETVAPLIEDSDNDFAALSLHNLYAVIAVRTQLDYAEALSRFKRARKIAQRIRLRHKDVLRSTEGLLLCNIASIYLIRRDTAGLYPAREAYALGCKQGDTLITASALRLIAELNLATGLYDRALAPARELEQIANSPGQRRHRLASRILMGDILRARQLPDSAALCYAEAERLAAESEDTDACICLDLRYGDFLLAQGDLVAAREHFERGLYLSTAHENLRYREQLLLALAETCYLLKDNNAALNCYRAYRSLSDSLPSLQREQAFNSLLLRNEKLEYERELAERELSLATERQHTSVILSLLALAIVIAGGTYYLYMRQNRLYRKLVEQYRRQAQASAAQTERQSGGDKDSQSRTLFETIEHLMQDEKVYRRNDMSLDVLVEQLSSNKSDVSRAINRHSGQTFYNYVNSYRIREAIAVLSDPNDDTPIKALSLRLGFNSLSVFYNSFSRETGVPPSKFRSIVRS